MSEDQGQNASVASLEQEVAGLRKALSATREVIEEW